VFGIIVLVRFLILDGDFVVMPLRLGGGGGGGGTATLMTILSVVVVVVV